MPLENVDRPLTLIAFLPDDLHKKVKHEDIVVKLMAKLSTDDVQCIQFMPNGYVRVTFTSMEARSEALLSGIFYDSLRLRVFEAQPAVFNVYVHHLPFEVSDRALEEVLCDYGVIHNVAEQTYPDSPIFNGNRIVKMTITSPIPANLRVLRFPCRVFYKDQPMSCYIYKKSHRAAECPLRDVCRHCRQPGHFAKDCTNVPDPPPAAPPSAPAAPPPAPAAPPPVPAAPPSVPEVNPPSCTAVDPVPIDDDDPEYSPPAEAEMSSASSKWNDEEITSGDEEVAAQVSSVPSSRRSPSSVPSSPAPKPAHVRRRRRKFKPKLDVTTVRPHKSAKFASPVPADPPPAQPSVASPAPHSSFALFVNEDFLPVDKSPSFSVVYCFDFAASTDVILADKSSFEEIRLASNISLAFSVLPDCPPPVDLPPLSADVVSLSFPSRESPDVP